MIGAWTQNYNPLGNVVLSTSVAALPVTVLFYLLAVRRVAAYRAAICACLSGIVLALAVFRMPLPLLGGTLLHGLWYALLRIAWSLLAAVFLYEVSVAAGYFNLIRESIGAISDDRRLQVLLIGFSFSAVLEGAGGGGSPVAISAAMLAGLGVDPFKAAALCLMANTVPVSWGAMGSPVRMVADVGGLPLDAVSAATGRILPWIALILPFWVIRAQVKTRETLEITPGLVVFGASFSGLIYAWSNFVNEALVAIVSGVGTLVILTAFLRLWQPATVWRYPGEQKVPVRSREHSAREILLAWSPFLLAVLLVVIWGLPGMKQVVTSATVKIPVPGLHQLVVRTPPVVPKNTPEAAVFDIAWLETPGTPVFLAGLIAGPMMGLSFRRTLGVFGRTVYRIRYSLFAILAMVCLGYLTRYSGMDAVMGLALTHTGRLFPIFGTFIGWLGVALSGTNAGSNALFGSLQVITANNLGINPVLMASANSAGGVMGKMVSAQSLIVACAATGLVGREGDLFRAVLLHSILLTFLIGLIVFAYAYLAPGWVPQV